MRALLSQANVAWFCEFLGDVQNEKHVIARSGVQLQVLLGEVQIGLAVLALLLMPKDHPDWLSL